MFTMSPPSGAHRLDRRARAPQDAEEVGLHHQAGLVVGVLPGLRGAQDAGVVDPDLQRSPLGRGRGDLAVSVGVADVLPQVPHVLAQQLGGLAGRVLVHVRDEYRVSACAQQARDLAADAAPRAGDHRRVHGAEINAREPVRPVGAGAPPAASN